MTKIIKRGKKIVVLDNRNRVIAYTEKIKNLNNAREMFRKYGGFDKTKRHERKTFKNVIEHTVVTRNKKIPRMPKPSNKRLVQYVVGTMVGRTEIYARSDKAKVGVKTNIEKMRHQAYDNFYKRLSNFFNPASYDADEGMQIAHAEGLVPEEGWVYYEPR